ncbi:VPLPA-CTERM sorting domain-containing protein [Roseovarius spongiae]|uniref:VPLPA-CTERM sorting domain-containing protein n=1 Tax=Roseovarius spongiae TaxID=2320272 RepID=A0A3A8AWJ6_9RHOB|nr:VPLPA-CTERM sorting domain-containing protein [Roseovarius spongiae]RKF16016.1 VPLPA-CTERM sorting domain-containing protein [Roseovarius spongiae]
MNIFKALKKIALAAAVAALPVTSWGATADAVTDLTLDFKFEGLVSLTDVRGSFGADPIAGATGSDARNVFNAAFFNFSFGSDLGASNIASIDNIGTSSGDYSGFSGFIFGSNFSLPATDPLFVRMELVSGSVDPFSIFYLGLHGDNASGGYVSQSQNPIAPVPLPAGFPLLLGGLGLFAFAARRKKQT